MSIRIAIADDHPMILGGVQNMIAGNEGIELTGAYLNAAELLAGLQVTTPDILLLDIQLPDKTGDTIAPGILKAYPELKILVLTNFKSQLYLNNMLRLGAHGYLLKTARQETFLKAVESVYQGRVFIDPAFEGIQEQHPPRVSIYNKVTLTLREKEILQLVVNGNSNQEIVEKLFLSINTVKTYMSRIFDKLDVKNRAELNKKALQLGLAE